MTPRERHFYRRGKQRAIEEGLMLTGVIALGLFAFRHPEVLEAVLTIAERKVPQ